MGGLGSIPGLGRSQGEGKGYPLRYSGLENSIDYIVHGVTESDTTERLSLSLGLVTLVTYQELCSDSLLVIKSVYIVKVN